MAPQLGRCPTSPGDLVSTSYNTEVAGTYVTTLRFLHGLQSSDLHLKCSRLSAITLAPNSNSWGKILSHQLSVVCVNAPFQWLRNICTTFFCQTLPQDFSVVIQKNLYGLENNYLRMMNHLMPHSSTREWGYSSLEEQCSHVILSLSLFSRNASASVVESSGNSGRPFSTMTEAAAITFRPSDHKYLKSSHFLHIIHDFFHPRLCLWDVSMMLPFKSSLFVVKLYHIIKDPSSIHLLMEILIIFSNKA